MRQALLAIFATICWLPCACSEGLVRQENVDEGEAEELVFENRFFVLVIDPARGASAISLKAKPSGTEMLLPSAKYGLGLFGDRFEEQGFGGAWRGPYAVKIDKSSPKEAAVSFTCQGALGETFGWVRVVRTVSVREDSPVIQVKVRIENAKGAPGPVSASYAIHNQIGNLGRKIQYYVPTTKGVANTHFVHRRRGGSIAHTHKSPSRGWLGSVDSEGLGLAFRLDHGNLDHFRQWMKYAISTVEMIFGPRAIEPGAAVETHYQVVIFSGLPHVDGVADGVAGAFVFTGEPEAEREIAARVEVAGQPGPVNVSVEWRRIPSPEWRPLHAAGVTVSANEVARLPFQFTPAGTGSYVLRAKLTQEGRETGALERLVVLGEPSGRYVMAPETPADDQLNPTTRDGAIPLQSGHPTTVRKVSPIDCRLVRGFIYQPIDGTTESPGYTDLVAEYRGHPISGVGYATLNGANGVHVRLEDAAGVDAVLVRGGFVGKMYREVDAYRDPGKGVPLCDISSRHGVFRTVFERPILSDLISFFYTQQGSVLADVTFLRIRQGRDVPGAVRQITYGVGRPYEPGDRVHRRLESRFSPVYRAYELTEAPGTALKLGRGEFAHLFTPQQTPDEGLLAVGLKFEVAGLDPGALFTVRVQDPLDARREIMCADFTLSGPGLYETTLDIPDQVFLPGPGSDQPEPTYRGILAPPPRIWISVASDEPIELKYLQVVLHKAPREVALPEALAWRKLILRGSFQVMSEPRPWMNLKANMDIVEALTTNKRIAPYANGLRLVLENVEKCRQLGPEDDVVREYYEWIYQGRTRIMRSKAEVEIPEVPGAPRWAVVLREAWRAASGIPRWWVENRLAPGGLLGSGINDDTDMFQTWASYPLVESEPLGRLMREGAAALAETAMAHSLERGINKVRRDALHAYEDGTNHLALCAWWFYGDPVHFERCMEAADSVLRLTMVTKDGRRHFHDDFIGVDDIKNGFDEIKLDGNCTELMLHPVYEVALYNRNPRTLKVYGEWADTWIALQKPGRYATAVEVETGKILSASEQRPGRGGCYGQSMGWFGLYQATGDTRFLKPYRMSLDAGYFGFKPTRETPLLATCPDLADYGDFLKEKWSHDYYAGGNFLLTRNRELIEQKLLQCIRNCSQYRYMNTAAEQYTDRVFVTDFAYVSICYTGAWTTRNAWVHYHAVSYEGMKGEDFAAQVMLIQPDALRLVIHNFREDRLRGLMRVWRLEHGRYRVAFGPDADQDGELDQVESETELDLCRYAPVALDLPPGRTTAIRITQIEKLDNIVERADLALSPIDTRLTPGGKVEVHVHNIGGKPSPATAVRLMRGDKVIATREIAPVEAPLDLRPRVVKVSFTGTKPGDRVVVDPENTVPEIAEHNNAVTLR